MSSFGNGPRTAASASPSTSASRASSSALAPVTAPSHSPSSASCHVASARGGYAVLAPGMVSRRYLVTSDEHDPAVSTIRGCAVPFARPRSSWWSAQVQRRAEGVASSAGPGLRCRAGGSRRGVRGTHR